jgi:curved DNA-binding protein CbpA
MRALTLTEAARILGVDPDIREKDLTKAWRKLARSCHPDLHPNNPEKEKEFKQLSFAYETLSAFNELARATHEMDSDILDDDLRFMINMLPEDEQKIILRKLRDFEESR